MSFPGVQPYMFVDQNPANYVVEMGKKGTYFTRHLPTGRVAANVMPGGQAPNLAGGNMLLGANLVVGLVNVGIGVYNAYKIHQVQEDVNRGVEEIRGDIRYLNKNIEYQSIKIQAAIGFSHQIIESHLDSIEGVLKIQQRNLEVLAFHQWQLSEQMNVLREEMKDGFNQVLTRIEDIDIQRQRDEFAKHTLLLHRKYKRFSNFLLEASEAELFNQAIELEHAATELEVWLDVALSKIERGQPERLPLRVAQTYAVRAKADANIARGSIYKKEANQDLDIFEKIISQEIYDLCNNKTLYYVGVEIPEVIAQYIYLHEGIKNGRQLLSNIDSGESLALTTNLEWTDELGKLRDLFRKKDTKDTSKNQDFLIPLKTISDIEWFIRFFEHDRESFDIAAFFKNNPSGIKSREFLDSLGIDINIDFEASDLEIIRQLYPSDLGYRFLKQVRSKTSIDSITLKIPRKSISNKTFRAFSSPSRAKAYDQLVFISDKYPSVKINELRQKQIRLTHLVNFNNRWIIVASPSLSPVPQIVIHDPFWLPAGIRRLFQEEFKITALSHSDTTEDWLIILSKKPEKYSFDVIPQEYSLSDLNNAFRKNEISGIIFEHIAIDSHMFYSTPKFAVTTIRNIEIEKQSLSEYVTFPDSISSKTSNGFFISSINIGPEIYILYSKYLSKEPPKQLFFIGTTFPVSDIEDGWEKGYNISHIAYGKCKWFIVMSDHNYPYET